MTSKPLMHKLHLLPIQKMHRAMAAAHATVTAVIAAMAVTAMAHHVMMSKLWKAMQRKNLR